MKTEWIYCPICNSKTRVKNKTDNRGKKPSGGVLPEVQKYFLMLMSIRDLTYRQNYIRIRASCETQSQLTYRKFRQVDWLFLIFVSSYFTSLRIRP